jgi:hypothetical protein
MSQEPESIIAFAIARSIKYHPDQAAQEMLKLIRENARLEGELFILKGNLLELAQGRKAAV